MVDSKPQILFLAHRVPYPPNRGDRIRSYHLIRHLAQRADVHLAFLSDAEVCQQTHDALTDTCRRVTYSKVHPWGRWFYAIAAFLRGRTATEGLFQSNDLRRQLTAWSDQTQYDAVFVFCSSMVQYLSIPSLAATPTVVDLVDVDSQKWLDYADNATGPKRWLLHTEGRRLRSLERSLPDRVETLTVTTSREADLYQSFRADHRPIELQNGVDLNYFRPQGEPIGSGHTRHSVVFVGALDYHANVDGAMWFSDHVWPKVRERFPDAVFNMVGSRPSATAMSLQERPGVCVVGEVPDVRPYLRDATIVVVPLRVARGVQNKVLEALAAGKPTIVSRQALEGIDATPNRDLLTADSVEQWVEQISRLFQSAEFCKSLGQNGREFVSREYQWPTRLEALMKIPALSCLPAMSPAD